MELSRRALLSSLLGMAGIFGAAGVAMAKDKKGKNKDKTADKEKKADDQDRSGKPEEKSGKRRDTVEGRATKRQNTKKQ